MRLIDANALMDEINWLIEQAARYNRDSYEDFAMRVKNAPTIEAVYICNRKKCDRCNPECDFTRDIDYAATTDKVIIIDGSAYAVKGKPAGQWIPNPFDPDWDYCTACGQGAKRREHGTDDGREWVREYGYSFCPNCGADMRGADDE